MAGASSVSTAWAPAARSCPAAAAHAETTALGRPSKTTSAAGAATAPRPAWRPHAWAAWGSRSTAATGPSSEPASAAVARAAASRAGNVAQQAPSDSGRGRSLKVASTMIPSVPRDPM